MHRWQVDAGKIVAALGLAWLPSDGVGAQTAWDCRAVGDAWQCREVEPGQSSNGGDNDAVNWDWVPLEQLTPAQREAVITGCCGAYIAPQRTDPEADIPPQQAPLRITGDAQTEGSTSAEVTVLTGDVTLTQGRRQLRADRIRVDQAADTAEISGNITIRDSSPDILIAGDRAFINNDTGRVEVDDARLVIHDLRVRARAGSIIRAADDVLTLNNSEFTRCEPADEQWVLRGSSFTIDPNTQQGRGRNVVLELSGVPVFYLPYIAFPAGSQRQSGFLFPSITSDDLAVPYYFNLAPHYDLTLTPRYIAERGGLVEVEARHLSRWFDTVVGGAYLPNGGDKVSGNERDAIETGDLTLAEAVQFDGEDRWLASVQQNGGRDADWYSTIDYTKVSDFAYFAHLDTTNLDINRATHLRQAGEVGYRLPNWNLSTRVEEYQSIVLVTEEPYQQKPRVEAMGEYRWGNVALNLDNTYIQFDHREEFANAAGTIPRITGERFRADYGLGWNKEWLWGFLKPRAMLKSLRYRLDEENLLPEANAEPSLTVPQGSLHTGLFFERDGSWFGDGYLQTFEPELFYLYSDFESHAELFNITEPAGTPGLSRDVDFDTSELTFSYAQLFRDTRFAGGDRIQDANQLSVGLTTRFLGNASGVERFRASVGQIYYFGDRRVTLDGQPLVENKSEIAGQFSAQLTDSWRFDSDVLYAPETDKVNRGSAGLRYFDDEYRIFNISYRFNRRPNRRLGTGEFVDNNENQGDISFILPLSESWSVIGREYYDFTNERELDSILGLEYTSCCYRIRLVGRRFLDNDLVNRVEDLDLEYERGIFFEFQLRGLGSLGRKIGDALSDGIVNYERREENLQ